MAASTYRAGPLLAILATLFLVACGSSTPDLDLGEERADSGEAGDTAAMIDLIKEISLQRYPSGEIKRFNQVKSLGCFDATFTVEAGLPEELRQGLFEEPGAYPARVRFANATEMDDTQKDFRGMSIKLRNVPGERLWGEPGEQDFLLNSYPALFAGNPRDFREFIEATRDDKLWRYFIRPSHFYSLKIVLAGREEIDSPFDIRYWSTTPYRFGQDPGIAVKYSTRPCHRNVEANISHHEHLLTEAMKVHLDETPACFDFMVQFQKDPVSMPIENASVTWDESVSPFKRVATVTIAKQQFTTNARVEECEAMTFNPWQSLPAHQPLGGINRVRRAVYSEIADFRVRNDNPVE